LRRQDVRHQSGVGGGEVRQKPFNPWAHLRDQSAASRNGKRQVVRVLGSDFGSETIYLGANSSNDASKAAPGFAVLKEYRSTDPGKEAEH
jgi:hypothetical protein